MKIEYSKGELENIIETVRTAENTDDLPLHAWARAAKVLDAIAASRLELLRELYDACIRLLMLDDDDPDGNWAEHIKDAMKVMSKVHKELGDDAESKTGFGPNDWS